MAMYQDKINAFVNRYVRRELYSNQFTQRPLHFMLARAGEYQAAALLYPMSSGGSKYPNDNWKKGVSIGGNMGLATRKTKLGSITHECRYQKSAPSGKSNVAPGGTTPTASSFSEDLFGTNAFKWTTDFCPYKLRNANLFAAKGETQIAALYEEALAASFNKFFDGIQTDMWDGTLTSAQQDSQEWASLLGLDHLVSDGSSTGETSFTDIGTVDRTVETFLKSTVLIGSTLKTNGNIPTTQPNLDLISQILTDPALGGITNYSGGTGDLVITTPALWNVLRSEAEDEASIVYGMEMSVPGTGKTVAFKNPVIRHGNSLICYDKDCQSGALYVLSTGSFIYEVAEGYNYKNTGLKDKSELEEGGEDYSWGQLKLKHRQTCAAPWLNVKVTGLTTS